MFQILLCSLMIRNSSKLWKKFCMYSRDSISCFAKKETLHENNNFKMNQNIWKQTYNKFLDMNKFTVWSGV